MRRLLRGERKPGSARWPPGKEAGGAELKELTYRLSQRRQRVGRVTDAAAHMLSTVSTNRSAVELPVNRLRWKWLFNDQGHRKLHWDDHCNRAYTRWILREHGISLIGPTPRSFMPPAPADLMHNEAAASLPTLLADFATWIDIDTIAWGQR